MSVLLIAPVYVALCLKETRRLVLAIVQLSVGIFGGVGMVLLVAFDVYTYPSWHYRFAGVFFLGMLVHMILSVLFHYLTSTETSTDTCWQPIPTMRVFLCIVNVVMTVFVILSNGETALFGKYEWVYMSTFCLYIASLYVDMTTDIRFDLRRRLSSTIHGGFAALRM